MPGYLKNRILLIAIFLNGLLSQAIALDATVVCQSLRCFDVPEGSISLQITKGQPDFLYLLFSDSLMKHEVRRSIPTSELKHSFTDLKAGNYVIKIMNNKGESFIKQVVLTQPPQLIPGRILVEKPLSTAGSSDAVIRANPSGGSPPYQFEWKSNNLTFSTQVLDHIGAGTYLCQITDAAGCGPVKATCFLQAQNKVSPAQTFLLNEHRTNSGIDFP